MNTPRRRTFALADEDTDVSTAAQGAERLAAADPDKMVTVEIAKSFNLTLDDGREVHYKAGLDEMPLSHATHWFAKAAGGVKLYLGRRATPEQQQLAKLQETASDKPPAGDPEKIKEAQAQGIAELKSLSSLDVLGKAEMLPADLNPIA